MREAVWTTRRQEEETDVKDRRHLVDGPVLAFQGAAIEMAVTDMKRRTADLETAQEDARVRASPAIVEACRLRAFARPATLTGKQRVVLLVAHARCACCCSSRVDTE